MVDLALTGGSEAPFSFGILKAWEAMRVVSPDTCRPFSRDRHGMVLGEGAGMLVLEPLDAALARGADPSRKSWDSECRAMPIITQPSAEGAAKAVRMALKSAGIVPEQVGYVNAHGTGTTVNDITETKALHLAFGDHAKRLAISSTKAMHGHTLGAAGALESAAAIMALSTGILPPTIHFNECDPECDLDYIPNCPRKADVEYAISNSFAFGGLNAVLAWRAFY